MLRRDPSGMLHVSMGHLSEGILGSACTWNKQREPSDVGRRQGRL